MKRIKHRRVTAWLTCLSVSLSLCTGILVGDRANAQSAQNARSLNARAALSKAGYPMLSRYATDLTQQASEGRLEPVKGHDIEISRIIDVLSSDSNKNPVVISELGLVTVQIAQGLAQRVAAGNTPESLRSKRILSLNLDALAANAKTGNEFTAHVQAVLAEAENAKGEIILFVDQLHQFVGAYAAQISTETMRASLEQGKIRIVGATTPNLYAEYIASDQELSALFQQVQVSDASEGENNSDENSAAQNSKNNDGSDRGFSGDRISPDLREMIQSGAASSNRVSLILQADDIRDGNLARLLKAHRVRVDARFAAFGAIKIDAPVGMIEKLAASGNTRYLSLDRRVQSMGHITATTGADAVRRQTITSGLLTTTTTFDGTGIGIAILDSGMDINHVAFLDKSTRSRIVFSRDFTGENRVDDPYGHGTHVTAIAAGNGRIANSAYLGMAPNANIVNLRVLNSQGIGSVSAILAALDWLMTNRTTYNVRVVNMSLGTPAVDSYKNDPICRAVRRLVDAGVVVAAAAGNNGKNSAGQKVYGQIHCPGNEPSALTVGAANTFGTDARNDDGVTTFSSRGPTRSYTTDAAGVKHFDNLIKPDVVAPGNKIINAESDGNLLVAENPQLDLGISRADNRREMQLSGSSMATPVVAGAAVMLLQANPNLTPNLIKMILMYTAQPLAGFNTLEQGAGEINMEGAMRLARLVRTDLGTSKPVGASLLSTTTLPVPQSTIAGTTFSWSQGIILGQHFAKGTSLIAKYQPVYAQGVIVSDNVLISNGVLISDGVIVSDGVIISDGVLISDGVIVSDGTTLASGTLFLNMGVIVSEQVIVSDGYALADGVIISDGVIVSDGVIISDAVALAQAAQLDGDLTTILPVSLDTGLDCLDY